MEKTTLLKHVPLTATDGTVEIHEPLIPRRWWDYLRRQVENELYTETLGSTLERERNLHCRWILSLMRKIETRT